MSVIKIREDPKAEEIQAEEPKASSELSQKLEKYESEMQTASNDIKEQLKTMK
jgi:hypothetical protein